MTWSEGLAPEIVYGLIPRFVGVLYVLGFGGLLFQHDWIAGSSLYTPTTVLTRQMRRDLPGLRTFFEFPSLFWLSSREATLRWAPVVGIAAASCAILGGPLGFWGLLVAWMIWLSLEWRGLVFPWDTMLQEVGFLVLFMPATQLLPEVRATELPLPSVAFAMRWFVLRLMIGFGKEKFIGARKSDVLYLRGFFVWMPLPTPLGWLAHHAPAWMLRAMLVFMFFAEVIAPVLGLFTGPLRLISCAVLVMLMVGIHITGNWGFFNIGYILLSVCLLDLNGSIFDLTREPWVHRLTSWPDVGVHAVMAALFVMSLFYLPNNSWLSRTWLAWPADMFPIAHRWMPLAQRIYRLLEPLRAMSGFRIVNGYGVFSPNAIAPMRVLPVFEGSDDGIEWKQYGYRHMPSFPHSRPPIIAPYHARFDQFTYYVTMGIDPSSMGGSLFPCAHPYWMYTSSSVFDQLVQRLLEHDPRAVRMFGHNPFPHAPPKQIRIAILGMTPTRVSELRATGHWWHVRRFGIHRPARGPETWPDRLSIPEPELYHPDAMIWRRRAKPLRQIVAAYRSGLPFDDAAIAGSDLTAADVQQFWQELVPELQQQRGELSALHTRREAVITRFGVEGLHRLERILERFVWLLRQQAERHRFGRTDPSLPVSSNFRFHMFLQECVIDGRDAYAAALSDSTRVIARAEHSTLTTQIWALGLLRYEQLMSAVNLFRGSEMGAASIDAQLPGIFEYYPVLSEVVPPGEVFRPRIVLHPDGEHTIDGFYPPPPLRTDRATADGGVSEPSPGL